MFYRRQSVEYDSIARNLPILLFWPTPTIATHAKISTHATHAKILWTHATHEPTQPRYPRHLRDLADSKKYDIGNKF